MTGPSRRDVLGLGLGTLVSLLPSSASSLGRRPYGGTVRMKLPWPLDAIDPHAVDDAMGALFGLAIADPLYAVDASGRPYPALAAALPEAVKGGLRVLFRPNLVSARGVALDGRDVLWSLARAERSGAAGLLAPLGKPAADPSDSLALVFPTRDAASLMSALSSPLTVILPRGYSRARPDGTGAFVADLARDQLILRRNLSAARGAALLDRIEVGAAADLREVLRAFETGVTDLSWIGEFLHKPRAGALKFDAGPFGWVVLRTGKDAGTWGAPGTAQHLLDTLPSGRLTHLGLTNTSGGAAGDAAWGGEATEILVSEGATHLEQIGKELSAILSRPGHELRVAARPRREIEYRRERGSFSLMLELVRPAGAGANAGRLGLLTLVNPALARKAPAGAQTEREAARTLPLGIVGQLRASGAHVPSLREVSAWDLGAVWKK